MMLVHNPFSAVLLLYDLLGLLFLFSLGGFMSFRPYEVNL
jgi:hypothetical protein